MPHAYLDQNVLINCANSKELHNSFLEVSKRGIRFVLSPWHFYEIGSTDTHRGNELIEIAESLEPEWILDRSDLQVAEFREAWRRFYGFPAPPFRPIGTLGQIAAVLLHERENRTVTLTLRDFVHVVRLQAQAEILSVLKHQRHVALANQKSVKEGLLTPTVRGEIQIAFGALMLARARERGPDGQEVRRNAQFFQRDSFTRSLLIYFRDSGQFDNLKAWQVESALTDLHHEGTAVLNENRQLDRQHVVTSLAYCDFLVTDDRELKRLHERIAGKVSFDFGEVLTAREFLQKV